MIDYVNYVLIKCFKFGMIRRGEGGRGGERGKNLCFYKIVLIYCVLRV